MPSFPNKAKFENVRCIRESASAILCAIDGDEIWIPQSQVDDDSEVFGKNHHGTLIVSQWIAEEKSLV